MKSDKSLYICFTLLIIFCYACKDQKQEPVLELISPVETTESIQGINFVWDADVDSPPRLEISQDISFDDPIVDTTLLEMTASYLLNEKLYPNTKYFWRLSYEDLTRESYFSTINLLAPYEGIHNLQVRERYWWDSGGLQSDTTYYSNFEFSVFENKLRINNIYDDNGQSVELVFRLNSDHEEILRYEYWNSHHIMFTRIYVEEDSISMYRENGSLGAWTTWHYSGLIE